MSIIVPDVLGILAIIACGACAAALSVAHALPTGQLPLRDAVSNYGAGAYRGWYRAAAVALGAAGLVLAVALLATLHPAPFDVVLLLLLFAATRGAIGWFPVDIDPATRTRRGRIHYLLAFAAFASLPVAAMRLNVAVGNVQSWQPYVISVRATGIGTLGAVLLMVLSLVAVRSLFGLFERLFYVAMIAWIVAVGIALAGGA